MKEFYELVYYDPQADDRRGSWETTGRFFKSKDKAQTACSTLNDEIIAKDIKRQRKEFDRNIEFLTQNALENNALIQAGLRSGPESIVPTKEFEYNKNRVDILDLYHVETRTFEDDPT